MESEGFTVTAESEATHWWFVSRRIVFLAQVARAIKEAKIAQPRILDYGCGSGFNLGPLSHFGSVSGFDPAEAHWRSISKADEFLRLTQDQVSAGNKTFAVVTALDVIEHAEADVELLASLRKLLAPRGQLVLTVPAYPWLWGPEDVTSQHKRRYTRRTLVRACEDAGLVVENLSFFNALLLPAIASTIKLRKIFQPRARTNVMATPPLVNAILGAVSSFEGRLVGNERVRFPFGASIIARLSAAR